MEPCLPTSKCPLREPYTLTTITAIRECLDLTLPLHATVFTCLTTMFFTAARTGEFTIPNLKAFNPARHITRTGVSMQQDQNSLQMTCFCLLWTKKSPIGEEVNWAKQEGLHDPEEALDNHFHVNDPPAAIPLFAYHSKTSFTIRTQTQSLKVS